jgi:hypothetical protein
MSFCQHAHSDIAQHLTRLLFQCCYTVLLLQLQAAAFEKRKQGATHQRHLLHAQATARAARDRDEIMRKIAAHTYDHYTVEHIHATARSPLQYDTVVLSTQSITTLVTTTMSVAAHTAVVPVMCTLA